MIYYPLEEEEKKQRMIQPVEESKQSEGSEGDTGREEGECYRTWEGEGYHVWTIGLGVENRIPSVQGCGCEFLGIGFN